MYYCQCKPKTGRFGNEATCSWTMISVVVDSFVVCEAIRIWMICYPIIIRRIFPVLDDLSRVLSIVMSHDFCMMSHDLCIMSLLQLSTTADEGGSYVQVMESFTSIGPIMDMSVVDLDKQGQDLVCGGEGVRV